MRCRKCDQPAAIYMRQHKLALCELHYPEWFVAQTQRAIEKYHMFGPQERVLVAVSGGKDSLGLWDVLLKLGYQADGLYIDLGIGANSQRLRYSAGSRAKVEQFAAQRPGIRYTVVDLQAEYGEALPDVALRVRRGQDKPCSVCGLIKRHAMNRVARDGGYDVLATGHNLDDEAAVLFGNVLHWQTGYIARQAPLLTEEAGLARKAKPFCRFYERETAAYTLICGIEYIYDECPYAVGATSLQHKHMLNQMEQDSPGTKLQFYLGFLRARKAGFFRDELEQVELTPCASCGQPTSAQGLCTFCRLWAPRTVPATPPVPCP
jgi:tRNA-5-methyluridine54 2-sulfurtransferase